MVDNESPRFYELDRWQVVLRTKGEYGYDEGRLSLSALYIHIFVDNGGPSVTSCGIPQTDRLTKHCGPQPYTGLNAN